jgi:hypothetical protein
MYFGYAEPLSIIGIMKGDLGFWSKWEGTCLKLVKTPLIPPVEIHGTLSLPGRESADFIECYFAYKAIGSVLTFLKK